MHLARMTMTRKQESASLSLKIWKFSWVVRSVYISDVDIYFDCVLHPPYLNGNIVIYHEVLFFPWISWKLFDLGLGPVWMCVVLVSMPKGNPGQVTSWGHENFCAAVFCSCGLFFLKFSVIPSGDFYFSLSLGPYLMWQLHLQGWSPVLEPWILP